jgi:hypothetical protein
VKDNRLTVGEPLTQFRGVLSGIPEFVGKTLDRAPARETV